MVSARHDGDGKKWGQMSGCPKSMIYGPCGGVRADGSCEVDGAPCVFLEDAGPAAGPVARGAASPHPAARDLLDLFARRRVVVAGMPCEAMDADGQRGAASILAGHADAALLGDAPWARVQLPPSLRASILAYEGIRIWATLSCRDRNRIALESELLGLAEVGVGAVHCVTGDHPLSGEHGDAEPVFDLDSPRLARLAAGRGMLVSVAEAPAAPPAHARARRVALKAAAGAQICFVDDAPAHLVAEFIAEAHERAPSLKFIACVPLATSAAGLQRLGVPARAGVAARLATAVEEADPVGAVVRTAVAGAAELLDMPGIAGVHLSAASAPGEELRVAAALALAADELGGGT